jgi:hypothetical protein
LLLEESVINGKFPQGRNNRNQCHHHKTGQHSHDSARELEPEFPSSKPRAFQNAQPNIKVVVDFRDLGHRVVGAFAYA